MKNDVNYSTIMKNPLKVKLFLSPNRLLYFILCHVFLDSINNKLS